MSVGGSPGRLVEPGERKGRKEFETARTLSLRYGDGGPVTLFGRYGIGRNALQQEVAAQAMNERQVEPVFDLIRVGQSFVDTGKRALDPDASASISASSP